MVDKRAHTHTHSPRTWMGHPGRPQLVLKVLNLHNTAKGAK